MKSVRSLGWSGLLLAVATLAGAVGPGTEVAVVRQALAALDDGRPEQAAALLEAAVLQDGPRRFAVWSLLGRTQLRLRQPEAAASSFAEALARAPGFLPARIGKAEADLTRGRQDEAAAELERLAALPAPPVKALELLGGLRLLGGDLDAARELWSRLAGAGGDREIERPAAGLLLLAAEGTPESRDRLFLEVERDLSLAASYVALGVERLLADEPAAAAELFRIGFEIDEHDPIVGLLLERAEGRPATWPAEVPRLGPRVAEIYAAWEERRLADAAGAAREILRLRPHHAPLELIVTRIAEEEGDHWSALAGYERLLQEIGELPSLAGGTARTALRVGAFGAAECGAREALRLHPGDTTLLRLLAAARAGAGARDESIEILREVAAREPTAGATWVQLGDLLFDDMRAEEAIEAYRRAVEIEPGAAAEIQPFALAVLVSEADGALDAELLARHAELHPERVDTLYSVGVARLRAGDLAGAEHLFEGLAAAAPGHSQVAYNLGQVYQRQGRPEEARAQMARFRELKIAEDADWELHNQAHFRRLAAGENEAAGRSQEALALYQANAAEGTADVGDYLAIARLLLAGSRASSARTWLEKVLAAAPYDRDALELMAAVDRALGRTADLERTRWRLELLERPCSSAG